MSCSKDTNVSHIVGTWQLSTRTIGASFDVNQDNIYRTNLIKEANCNDIETLTFTEEGTVFSGNEYVSDIIYFKYDDSDNYGINVECDKNRIISFASEYEDLNEASVLILDKVYRIEDHTLTTIFEDAITIYNEDLTTVIETRDLKLVYIKQ